MFAGKQRMQIAYKYVKIVSRETNVYILAVKHFKCFTLKETGHIKKYAYKKCFTLFYNVSHLFI
jgi:hypothetical protein